MQEILKIKSKIQNYKTHNKGESIKETSTFKNDNQPQIAENTHLIPA